MSNNTQGDRQRLIGIDEFPGVPLEYAEVLKSRGITQTLQFMDASRSAEDRKQLAAETGIPFRRLQELRALSGLTGIPCISPDRARLLYYAGYRSVEALARADGATLAERVNKAGKAYPEAVASLKEEDLYHCIQQAKAIRDLDLDQEQPQ